jgi:hypothetical protein
MAVKEKEMLNTWERNILRKVRVYGLISEQGWSPKHVAQNTTHNTDDLL